MLVIRGAPVHTLKRAYLGFEKVALVSFYGVGSPAPLSLALTHPTIVCREATTAL